MKIQCDVCSKDEASVFCCADEAALCAACDRRVHIANKLASKHRRFFLSSADQTQPLCDICKERRGFVFCQEDRAILCRDCDDPIHAANQLTMKHKRFLLTGARLCPTPLSSTSPPLLEDAANQLESDSNSNKFYPSQESSVAIVEESSVISTPITAPAASNGASDSGSSISEYLMKTIPGYCVEDLLVDDADGLHKNDEMVPFLEPIAVAGQFTFWAPHVPQDQSLSFLPTGVNGLVHCDYTTFSVKELNHQSQQSQGLKGAREQQWSDDYCMVPQINTCSVLSSGSGSGNKRPRSSSAWDF